MWTLVNSGLSMCNLPRKDLNFLETNLSRSPKMDKSDIRLLDVHSVRGFTYYDIWREEQRPTGVPNWNFESW